MTLRFNAFRLHYSSDRVTAYRHPLPDPSALKALRQQFDPDWFIHWRGGIAWGIPRVHEPKTHFGSRVELSLNDYEGLSLIAARTGDQLPSFLPQYPALPGRKRAFRFVAQKSELVTKAVEAWQSVPPLLRQFEIRPRFACEARLIELQEDRLQVVLVVEISMHWFIGASLPDLRAAGVDVKGLYGVRRVRIPEQRNLLGRISGVDDSQVFFDESYEDMKSMPIEQVALEPSKMSFARCLRHILGRDYEKFRGDVEREEVAYLGGAGYDGCLGALLPALSKHQTIYIAENLSVKVGNRVELEQLEKPRDVSYCFDAGKTKQHPIAWTGLTINGPFSHDSFPRRAPQLLVICPDESQSRVEQALRKFKDGIPQSTFAKGFPRYFHLASVSFDICPVPLRLSSNASVAENYSQATERHLRKKGEYDAAIVVVEDKHSDLSDEQNPYLFAKAQLLTNGIPVQEARLSTLSRPDGSLQYVFQNFGVALYAKMGGVPWTVNQDQTVNDEVVIGMGLVETSGSRFEARKRFVGITTVFRGDGNYLLANVSRECRFEDYRDELRGTMVAVLSEIKERNGWRKGDTVRVVFHASKPLRDLEVDELMHECVTQAASEQEVQFAFVDVIRDHPFRIFDPTQKGKPTNNGAKGVCVPARGTSMQLGKNTWLVCTNGISQIKKATTPLPSPLLVHLHRKSTGCDLPYLADQVLKFTSLTWRSTQPAGVPVTILYSELIAGLLVRLRSVPGWSPNVLNTKLRASKWFL